MLHVGQRPFWAFLFFAAAVFLPETSSGQSLGLNASQLVIGAKLQGSYAVPEGDDQPRFAIGIRQRDTDVLHWRQWVPQPGRGTMDLQSPQHPGDFEAVLFDSDDTTHAVVPFRAIVTQTPGALRPDKNRYIIGEPISLSVRREENRYYGNGWIGFFYQGNHAEGGSSLADRRLSYQRFPKPDEPLVFTAPSTPGTYEFRLFDRDAWHYVLDRVAIQVVAPPTPGVMALDKEVFTIGEQVDLQVALEEGRHYGNAWIGLFDAESEAPGGGGVQGNRITYQRVNLDTESLAFTAPASPGVYEFRLYDRDARYYMLDSLSFEVTVPPTPGVMSLARETFTIGEPVTLQVQLEPGRHYGNAWIGLYRSEQEAPGGAKVERDRITYQRVKLDTAELTFTAPASPGDYEFVLYDRDAAHYQLDRVTFKIEVPPTPGVMSLSKDSFIIGEPIPLAVSLEPGRYYGNAWIGLFRRSYDAPGGGAVARDRVTYQRVKPDTGELNFTAPASPGGYQFRLYDRDAYHYLLDTIDFEVVVPPTPDVLSLSKSQFVTGEPMRLAVQMEQGRYYGNSWIGLYRERDATESGAEIAPHRETYQRVNLDTTALDWTAPASPGRYSFKLFDRDAGHYKLASIEFDVVSTAESGLLSIQSSRYGPGELVRVRVRMPENRTLNSPWVELTRSSHAVNGGALGAEYRDRSFRVSADTPALSFEAPQQPGPYELRFYDRGGNGYILDIATFAVVKDPPSGIERRPDRFTPLPGGPSVALGPGSGSGSGAGSGGSSGGSGDGGGQSASGDPDEGLPGRPVRPDGTPVAQPNPNVDPGGAGGSGNGGSGGGSGDDGATETGDAGEPPDGSTPSLRFVGVGSEGLADISSIKGGQPFIIEARYAEPPESETVIAQLSYGKAGAQDITLHRAGEPGVYRSGVIRLPGGGGN